MGLKQILFPPEPRPLAGRRWIKVLFRAVHVLFAAGFLGAYLFAVGPQERMPWTIGVLVSGSALLLLDLHETGAFLLQVRGLVVMVKIALLCALPLFHGSEAWILSGIFVLSVVSSHAPGSVRHRVLFGDGSIQAAESHG